MTLGKPHKFLSYDILRKFVTLPLLPGSKMNTTIKTLFLLFICGYMLMKYTEIWMKYWSCEMCSLTWMLQLSPTVKTRPFSQQTQKAHSQRKFRLSFSLMSMMDHLFLRGNREIGLTQPSEQEPCSIRLKLCPFLWEFFLSRWHFQVSRSILC